MYSYNFTVPLESNGQSSLSNLLTQLFSESYQEQNRRAEVTLEREQVSEPTTCPICWEQIEDTCIRLTCDHKFHETCIQRWLDHRNTCPVCRSNINQEEDHQREQSRPQIDDQSFIQMSSNVSDIGKFELKIIFMNSNYHTMVIRSTWKVQDTLQELFSFLDVFPHLQTEYFLQFDNRVIKKNNSLNLMNTPISYFLNGMSHQWSVKVYTDT